MLGPHHKLSQELGSPDVDAIDDQYFVDLDTRHHNIDLLNHYSRVVLVSKVSCLPVSQRRLHMQFLCNWGLCMVLVLYMSPLPWVECIIITIIAQ